jgi:hypothetical protein
VDELRCSRWHSQVKAQQAPAPTAGPLGASPPGTAGGSPERTVLAKPDLHLHMYVVACHLLAEEGTRRLNLMNLIGLSGESTQREGGRTDPRLRVSSGLANEREHMERVKTLEDRDER